MTNYMTFKQVISRVKYGTKVHVAEEFTEKEVFNRMWRHSDRLNIFPHDVLSAEVTSFTVQDGCLRIEIVKQEDEEGDAE